MHGLRAVPLEIRFSLGTSSMFMAKRGSLYNSYSDGGGSLDPTAETSQDSAWNCLIIPFRMPYSRT
eukprot:5057713-Pyramimonas_sp.AAC.1